MSEDPHTHAFNPEFGAAFEKMSEAVEQTQAEPTRPMKARLAKGLARFGEITESALNHAMPAVGGVALVTGAAVGVGTALYGYHANMSGVGSQFMQENGPMVGLLSLFGGAGLGMAGLNAAIDQSIGPDSAWRKFTRGVRDAMAAPFKKLQEKAKTQGPEWEVDQEELGYPREGKSKPLSPQEQKRSKELEMSEVLRDF